MSVGTVAELLQLGAADLAELLAEAAPGELVEVQAAALGLDLEVAEHRAAVLAAVPLGAQLEYWQRVPVDPAIGGQVRPDPGVSAAQEGVRLNLTPNPPAPASPHTDMGEPSSGLTEALSVDSIVAMIERYRGSAEPMAAGTFALYATPDGGLMMVTQDAAGDVHHFPFHPRMVKMAMGMLSGRGPLARIARSIGK